MREVFTESSEGSGEEEAAGEGAAAGELLPAPTAPKPSTKMISLLCLTFFKRIETTYF